MSSTPSVRPADSRPDIDALLGAVDKGLVDRLPSQGGHAEKQDDDAEPASGQIEVLERILSPRAVTEPAEQQQ